MYWAWLIEKPISSSSDVIVLHVLGLPLFLLPGGVQCRATLGILLGVILNTCPSHLLRLCSISSTMFLHLLFNLSWWAVKFYWSCVSSYCGRLQLSLCRFQLYASTHTHTGDLISHYCCRGVSWFSDCIYSTSRSAAEAWRMLYMLLNAWSWCLCLLHCLYLGDRSTQRKPPTCCKWLTNFIK